MVKEIDMSKLEETSLNDLTREITILKHIARLNEVHPNVLKIYHLHLNEGEKTFSIVQESWKVRPIV